MKTEYVKLSLSHYEDLKRKARLYDQKGLFATFYHEYGRLSIFNATQTVKELNSIIAERNDKLRKELTEAQVKLMDGPSKWWQFWK